MTMDYTDETIENIIEIFDYIAKDNYYYACQTRDEIKETIDTLIVFPNRGKKVESKYSNILHRRLVSGSYIIYYNDTIQITAIKHGARKQKKKSTIKA